MHEFGFVSDQRATPVLRLERFTRAVWHFQGGGQTLHRGERRLTESPVDDGQRIEAVQVVSERVEAGHHQQREEVVHGEVSEVPH